MGIISALQHPKCFYSIVKGVYHVLFGTASRQVSTDAEIWYWTWYQRIAFAVLKMISPLEKDSQVMLYWGQRKSRRVQPRRPGKNALTEPSNERWLLEQATKSREIPPEGCAAFSLPIFLGVSRAPCGIRPLLVAVWYWLWLALLRQPPVSRTKPHRPWSSLMQRPQTSLCTFFFNVWLIGFPIRTTTSLIRYHRSLSFSVLQSVYQNNRFRDAFVTAILLFKKACSKFTSTSSLGKMAHISFFLFHIFLSIIF